MPIVEALGFCNVDHMYSHAVHMHGTCTRVLSISVIGHYVYHGPYRYGRKTIANWAAFFPIVPHISPRNKYLKLKPFQSKQKPSSYVE